MYFYFRSIRVSFISKVTRVLKAKTVANTQYKFMFHHFGCVSWISSRSTGLKFPIWTDHKIRPCHRASPVTGLLWRGPFISYELSQMTRATCGASSSAYEKTVPKPWYVLKYIFPPWQLFWNALAQTFYFKITQHRGYFSSIAQKRICQPFLV